MTYSDFKKRIEQFYPLWEVTSGCIWCPKYMKPTHGYVMIGRGFDDIKSEDHLLPILIEISRMALPILKLRDGTTFELKPLL